MERAKNTALVLAETPSPRLYLEVSPRPADNFMLKSVTQHYVVENNQLVLKSEEMAYARAPQLFLTVEK